MHHRRSTRTPTEPPCGCEDHGRRAVLRGLAGGLVALGAQALAARPAFATALPGAKSAPLHRLTLHHTHTLETTTVAFRSGDSYLDAGLETVAHALRDHRTGDVHPIDPRLLDLLHAVAERTGHEPEFEIISGFRSSRTNAMLQARSSGVASRSLHLEGRAIDVRLVGCDLERLRDAALELEGGGVGMYRASRFVHIDTGRVRRWGD